MSPDNQQPVDDNKPSPNNSISDGALDNSAESNSPETEHIKQDSPADALSRTPDDLAEEREAEQAGQQPVETEAANQKKSSAIKKFFRKVNLYFLLFFLLVVVAGAITVVNYLNSQKEPERAAIAGQELTEESLRQLANTDASVGGVSQTLTIQGNAIIDGQTLLRANLNVAGDIQSGGSIRASEITISGAANLGNIQTNSLQVAANTAIEGSTTLRDLSVSGTSTFSGSMTASQITTSNLVLSGNASLQIPNHISFTGPSPSRSISPGVLGAGGSASVAGSDTTGTVNINTGNGPTAGCFVRINFNQQFSNQPHVLISPVGAAAGKTEYYVERNNSGFSICAASPAPANQAFAFDYFVTN